MIEYFTEEEYQKAKSTDFLPLKCEHCGEIFPCIKKQITFERKHKKGIYRYCSRICQAKGDLKLFDLKCDYCGKIITKKKSDLEKSKHHFCNSQCAAKYNNTHRTYGFSRSKLEIYLEKKLKELYSNLDFKFNDRITIGSELDILIPSLNLAFELNGIFHYEPIYGEETYNKIKIRDKNKFQMCLEHKISLCIIDTSSQKYFNERSSQKFLNIIKEIIDENLSIKNRIDNYIVEGEEFESSKPHE